MIKGLGCLLIDNSRSRAYLQKLINNGLIPEAVVVLILKKAKKPATALDGTVGSLVNAAYRERKYFLYDPEQKSASILDFKDTKASKYESFDKNESVLETLEKHGLNHVVVEAASINDPEVIDVLKKVPPRYLVFGGGGILRKEILSIGKKFIHCHPGWVPDFRGSHCIEWSVLLSDACAVTSFFMNEVIDGGEIIAKRKFEFPEIDNGIPPLYSSHIRSELLVEVVRQFAENGSFPIVGQDLKEGETYYKMHPAITNLVFQRLENE